MRVGLRLPVFVRFLARGTSGNLLNLVDYVTHGATYVEGSAAMADLC